MRESALMRASTQQSTLVLTMKGATMPFHSSAFFPTRGMLAGRLAIRDWAQAAEALGCDFFEVSDHVLGADRTALPDFQGPYDVDEAFHETCMTKVWALCRTRLQPCGSSTRPCAEEGALG